MRRNIAVQAALRARKECCGTCCWHLHEDIDDGWVCVNGRSEYCTDWTDYGHTCSEWEERAK